LNGGKVRPNVPGRRVGRFDHAVALIVAPELHDTDRRPLRIQRLGRLRNELGQKVAPSEKLSFAVTKYPDEFVRKRFHFAELRRRAEGTFRRGERSGAEIHIRAGATRNDADLARANVSQVDPRRSELPTQRRYESCGLGDVMKVNANEL